MVSWDEISEVSFHSQEWLENERFAAAGSRCGRNLRFENFTLLFGRLRQRNVFNFKACRSCSMHDYLSLYNQSYQIFVALPLLVLTS